jgi:hypothetical protein
MTLLPHTTVCQLAHVTSERTMWRSKLLEILKSIVRRVFKSWLT